MPYLSARGLDIIFNGAFPGFGIGVMPASQLAQCQASAFCIVLLRMMKDLGFPWSL